MRDFKSALNQAGLRQNEFARMVSHLAGISLSPVTVNRWCSGLHAPPPLALAFLALWNRLDETQRDAIREAASQ